MRAGAWSRPVDIKGDQGDQGPRGTQGEQGPPGMDAEVGRGTWWSFFLNSQATNDTTDGSVIQNYFSNSTIRRVTKPSGVDNCQIKIQANGALPFEQSHRAEIILGEDFPSLKIWIDNQTLGSLSYDVRGGGNQRQVSVTGLTSPVPGSILTNAQAGTRILILFSEVTSSPTNPQGRRVTIYIVSATQGAQGLPGPEGGQGGQGPQGEQGISQYVIFMSINRGDTIVAVAGGSVNGHPSALWVSGGACHLRK